MSSPSLTTTSTLPKLSGNVSNLFTRLLIILSGCLTPFCFTLPIYALLPWTTAVLYWASKVAASELNPFIDLNVSIVFAESGDIPDI